MKKASNYNLLMENRRVKKRPGIVSKNKSSFNKSSKFYRKKYRGQGKRRKR